VHACVPEQTAQVAPPVPQAPLVLPVWHVPWLSTQPLQVGVMHWPLVHTCVPLQTAQVAPPVPQAPLVLPVWHTLLASQHPLQVGVTHWLLVQCERPVQTEQVVPPVPQAPSLLPVWQTWLASTHPLHEGLTHWLLVQRALPAHTAQVAPPVPQAPSALPTWQVPLLSTQPRQPGLTHWPLVHCWLPLHTWQVAPLFPQAEGVLDGVMHAPLGAQHPLTQVELQLPASLPPSPWPGTMQTPAWQTSEAEQKTQAPPRAPHAAEVVPDLQSPSPPQQPLQLAELQAPPVWPHEGTKEAATPTAKASTKVRRELMNAYPDQVKSSTWSPAFEKGAT
jgi:hypothetical protein